MPADTRVGVVVLGMHRSGTSAAARLLSLLGFSLGPAEELLPPQESNPSGFWESAPLVDLNDEILRALGGEWSAPPQLDDGWADRAELDLLRPVAAALVQSRLGGDRWTWKDPRTCLTLPFWSALLDSRVAVVLVHRNPLEVAASLRARDSLPDALGLALWERYIRSALAAARGLPVLVTTYERVLADPARWCEEAGSFLRSCGAEPATVPRDEVEAFVRPELRHATADDDAVRVHPAVSVEQYAIHRALEAAAGPHDSFAPLELPPETPWVEPLLGERRRALRFEQEAHRGSLAAQKLAAIEASRSYRALAPVRAVGDALLRQRARMRAPDAEAGRGSCELGC